MRLVLPLFCGLAATLCSVPLPGAPALPLVSQLEWQPFTNQLKRLIEAADFLGGPLEAPAKEELLALLRRTDTAAARVRIQEVLDAHCLVGIQIDPEMRLTVAAGPASPALVEQGWRLFLVKIANASGTTAALRALSPQARSLSEPGSARTDSDDYFHRDGEAAAEQKEADRWLALAAYDAPPLSRRLTGLDLEYRILQACSSAPGPQKARLIFQVGSAKAGKGGELELVFDCAPARDITLRIRDENDQPTTAALVIRDAQGRLYPPSSKRLPPDLAFQPQVYRADGEVLRLAAGTYTVQWSRGPESVPQSRPLEAGEPTATETFRVERWIDPARFGWWSGDPHLHAIGCVHDARPVSGPLTTNILRHTIGEDLKMGLILITDGLLDSSKELLSRGLDPASQYPHLLRYGFEVTGLGSSGAGHLLLLGLRDPIEPGGEWTNQGPAALGLDMLRWARKQGAMTGAAHVGWGLETKAAELPNYAIPPFRSTGAHEYIVDVTHELPGPDGSPQSAVDFIGVVAAPPVSELNVWYHTLNVGFRTRIAGESGFSCAGKGRVGLGRSYVWLEDRLDDTAWLEGLSVGRSYVSDGKSHLLDFKVNNVDVGRNGSELALDGPGPVQVTARVAARLSEKPEPGEEKPSWDLERARLGETREVPVEVVVNGQAVGRTNLVADGTLRDVQFEVALARSSWVALRILPSSHSNPIFVLVGGKPIRASKRSAEWCLKGVDQSWSEKEKFIQKNKLEKVLEDAKAAYDHARAVYQDRVKESVED